MRCIALHSPEFLLLIALQIRIQIAGNDAVDVRGPCTGQQRGRRRCGCHSSGNNDGCAAFRDVRTLAAVAGGQISVCGLGGAIRQRSLWLVWQLRKRTCNSQTVCGREGGRGLTCCRKLVGFLGTCGGTLGGASVGVARLRVVEAPAKLLRLFGDGGGRGCSTSGGGGGGSGSSKV